MVSVVLLVILCLAPLTPRSVVDAYRFEYVIHFPDSGGKSREVEESGRKATIDGEVETVMTTQGR